NAHLNVGNFKAKAGDKFKMAGAVINTENADIEANQLLMESLLDTESGRHKSVSGGVDYNFVTEKFTIHGAASKGSHKSANIKEQTGIKATGTFTAKIDNVTHLKSAYIDAANGTLDTKRFIHEDIEEVNQRKQMGFSFSNLELSKEAGDAEVDAYYQSKNQKNRLKAGVSSGVQIITNSNISNLNRDLKNARKHVKNHKHYARVVVPIPGEAVGAVMGGFGKIGDGLKRAFDVLTDRKHVDSVPKFIRDEIKEDLRVYEEIQNATHLNDEEKEYGWNHYKAVKQAERYGQSYLAGKNEYSQVKIGNGTVQVDYTSIEHRDLARDLSKLITPQQDIPEDFDFDSIMTSFEDCFANEYKKTNLGSIVEDFDTSVQKTLIDSGLGISQPVNKSNVKPKTKAKEPIRKKAVQKKDTKRAKVEPELQPEETISYDDENHIETPYGDLPPDDPIRSIYDENQYNIYVTMLEGQHISRKEAEERIRTDAEKKLSGTYDFDDQYKKVFGEEYRELGVIHKIVGGFRLMGEGWDSLSEEHPYLVGGAQGALFMRALVAKFGKTVAFLGVSNVLGMNKEDMLGALNDSSNHELKAFEIKWGLTRDDSLWLASAFFTLATDKVAAKAVGGASSAL
ncbi:MAG: hypothetical protein Q8K92_27015, partial [Leadbetterella sp.]|nr:hypothetical protein [Leadbetterella sp.]